MNRYGHLKLRAALKTESTRENSMTTSINSSHSVNGKRKVVMQCSSFASIMPSISQRKNRNGFLYELQQSLLYPRSPSSTSSSSSSGPTPFETGTTQLGDVLGGAAGGAGERVDCAHSRDGGALRAAGALPTGRARRADPDAA